MDELQGKNKQQSAAAENNQAEGVKNSDGAGADAVVNSDANVDSDGGTGTGTGTGINDDGNSAPVDSNTDEVAVAAPNENGTAEIAHDNKNANVNANANTAKSNLASKDPDDVSREELLTILKQMNKKVKTLSSLRVQLIERVKLAESDKSRLMAIVKEEILTEVDLDEATQKAAIMNAESAMKAAEDDANVNGNATVGGDSNANGNGNTQNGGDTDQQQTKKQV